MHVCLCVCMYVCMCVCMRDSDSKNGDDDDEKDEQKMPKLEFKKEDIVEVAKVRAYMFVCMYVCM